MKNFRQNIEKITVTGVGAATAGLPYYSHADAIKGIAESDAAAGEKVVIVTEGIFTLPAATAGEIELGDALYWDGSLVTTVAETNKLLGIAFTAKAAATAGEVEVLVTK